VVAPGRRRAGEVVADSGRTCKAEPTNDRKPLTDENRVACANDVVGLVTEDPKGSPKVQEGDRCRAIEGAEALTPLLDRSK
jgi:hypothetical protein